MSVAQQQKGILNDQARTGLVTYVGRERTIVFAVMRNEMLRLKAWISHYQSIGLQKFVIVDNGSTDGTFEYLRDNGAYVIQTSQSYAESRFGIAWLAEVTQAIEPGTIVINVDGDELLVYDGWPKASADEFLEPFRRSDCDNVFGFMLDMYPQEPTCAAAVAGYANLFEVAPLHDGDYVFRVRPARPWRKQDPKGIEVLGGPRTRMLSSLEKEARSTWLDHMIQGQIDRVIHRVPQRFVKPIVRLFPAQMPALSKYPIFKATGSALNNVHSSSGKKTYRRNVVLCHFKFLPDFAAKAEVEAERGEHFRRGAEYIMYGDGLKRLKNGDLRYPGSIKFSPAVLAERKLLRDISEFL